MCPLSARRAFAYNNTISQKKHPNPAGRSVEVKADPRLQKKIAHIKGIKYQARPISVVKEEVIQIVDAFAAEPGMVGSYEEELGQVEHRCYYSL